MLLVEKLTRSNCEQHHDSGLPPGDRRPRCQQGEAAPHRGARQQPQAHHHRRDERSHQPHLVLRDRGGDR